MNKRLKTLAAIDIGTNSIHLLVVEFNPSTGRFRVLDREKEIVRLGSGSTDMKHLTERAMLRGIKTLRRFKLIAGAVRAPIRAVATSAVREALNRGKFTRRVKKETGINVEVISGVEEARLIYLGVLQALSVFDRRTLLIDVGGGSTEFLIGKKRKILYDNSLKMGAVRLTHRFFDSKKINPEAVDQCRRFILGLMSPVVRAVKDTEFEVAVGTSGTILSIANMIRVERGDDSSPRLNNFRFTREELFSVTGRILRAKNVKERAKLDGLDSGRADIIVAGALILEQIFKQLKIKKMSVSEYALREGVVYDTIEKMHRPKKGHLLNDIRFGSVTHLAESLGYERRHSHHVAQLALRIFDQMKEVHELGPREREFLEAAAILHEVGLFISHTQHHRHSYYLIRNAELLGFTENEKEIIANVARYHRKSHPKPKHEGFRNLTPEEQSVVTKLAAILRIADGLDRTHGSVIRDITFRKSGKSLIFRLRREQRLSPDLEIWGANRKKDLFEDAFGKRIKFVLAQPSGRPI